jgi:hypothetical protein
MTALRPRDDLPELRSGATSTVGSTGRMVPAAIITSSGVGALDALEALDLGSLAGAGGADAGRDAIVLGAQAMALIRAGLAVRAFVLLALARTHLTRTIGGRVVTLEFGVYR